MSITQVSQGNTITASGVNQGIDKATVFSTGQTIGDNDYNETYILDGSTGDVTLTLPKAIDNQNKKITIINNGTNKLTVSRSTADTIDNMQHLGLASIELPHQGMKLELVAVATDRWVNMYHQEYFIPVASRASDWLLSSGASTSFTDADASTVVPVGAYAIKSKYFLRFVGDGVQDQANVLLRPNGTTIDDQDQVVRLALEEVNLTGTIGIAAQTEVTCDTGRIVEYRVGSTHVKFFWNPEGFWL